MKDLVLLVADKNAQFALQGALERPEALGIRHLDFEFRVHVGRDGGARRTGPEMLALEHQRFSHALLVLDFEGCGTNLPTASDLEQHLDSRLRQRWADRAKSIVIEPELDVWMWGSDNALEDTLGWCADEGVREWLRDRGFAWHENQKPSRPKEAMEAVLRELRTPRSSALYRKIAGKISLRRCADPAFQRLRRQLTAWFGAPMASMNSRPSRGPSGRCE
jgi:hypothetical protein